MGAPLLGQPGATSGGKSVYLNGHFYADPDYIQIPNSPTLNITETFTLEMWIKPSGDSRYGGPAYILDKDFDTYSVIIGFQAANAVNFFKHDYVNNDSATSLMSVPINVWSHIVFTKGPNGTADNWRGLSNGAEVFCSSADFTLGGVAMTSSWECLGQAVSTSPTKGSSMRSRSTTMPLVPPRLRRTSTLP